VKVARTAIVLAFIGVLLCLWLLVQVTWYSFIAFMLIAQPLLVLSVLIFAITAVRGLKRTGVL
jgi:hypothetical protein